MYVYVCMYIYGGWFCILCIVGSYSWCVVAVFSSPFL